MKTCFQIERGFGWPIKLEQCAAGDFRVTYGKQVKDHLNYADAGAELGACIMHAVACEGNLDNEAA